MKLLFIVQRYGLEVDGGAEQYCRWLAEHIAHLHDVTVLTTAAKDYITWANQYPAGQSTINHVTVIRTPVAIQRDMRSFNALTEQILSSPDPDDETQKEWLRAQGPWSPELIDYIEKNHTEYDLLIFVTYLYAPTVIGSSIAPWKSLLIPTAHDEPVASLPVFKHLYSRVAGFIYLTEPEKAYVEKAFSVPGKPHVLLGTGIDLLESTSDISDIRKKYDIDKPFVLYMGRIETGKGCEELLRYFQSYRLSRDPGVMLVLAGRLHMPLPDDPAIRYIGFVPETDIRPLMEASHVIAVPSPFESLSILLLQALACSRPVIANAKCPVLVHHCEQSNAGLHYNCESEFVETLDLILHCPNLRETLGRNGVAYIDAGFRWNQVVDKLDLFIRQVQAAV